MDPIRSILESSKEKARTETKVPGAPDQLYVREPSGDITVYEGCKPWWTMAEDEFINEFGSESLERVLVKEKRSQNATASGKQIKKGAKVIFNLGHLTTPEDWDVDEEYFQRIAAHDGDVATVTGVDIEGEGDEGYSFIKFDDGFDMDAVSHLHLTPVNEESIVLRKSVAEATRQQIDANIAEIFNKHGIRPSSGEDGFWDAVDQVAEIDADDATKLELLAGEWEAASNEAGLSDAGKDFQAALELKPAILSIFQSLSNLCESIDTELSEFNAPGLKAAVIKALKAATAHPSGSKFDYDRALKRIEDYYKRHED